ncbi:hypothetical protein CCR75_005649 [Bremia lactucae]|uniref:Uncharacterized protein n=1 Tax=Bremia lactucae TaxID=4779 RepID=A0A976IFS9_BRELC|nr:hypothetical protein CCR75_005649 [Bremia lactucae]
MRGAHSLSSTVKRQPITLPMSAMRGSPEPVRRKTSGQSTEPPDPKEGVTHDQRDRTDSSVRQTTGADTDPLTEAAEVGRSKPTAKATATQEQPIPRRTGAPSEPRPDKAGTAIRPAEMFEAVVAAVKVAPNYPPHEAWVATMAELYTIAHDTVAILADLVPAGTLSDPTNEEKVIFI